MSKYYDETEFLEAVKQSEEAEKEAQAVKEQVFSTARGKSAYRPITEEDFNVLNRADEAWSRVIEIARRPNKPLSSQ